MTEDTLQKRIKETFHYNPDTGIFTRLKSRYKNRIGQVVGTIDKHSRAGGIKKISFEGKNWRDSVLAWVYVTGERPNGDIKHIDGNSQNNKWNNLKLVDKPKINKPISHSEVLENFHYDPETGILYRKKGMHKNLIGKEVGWLDKSNNYRHVRFNSQKYKTHRLIWFYMTGEFPKEFIDHINHNTTDNRWCNLREVSRNENSKNTKLYSNNTSGYSGVHYSTSSEKWNSSIKDNGVTIHLGRFDNKEDAIKARKEAEVKYGFHENHGE